jgi:prepilin-type N-terminal cleavage/methylation domain-containing protein
MRRAAFTMIELIMTIVIMGILAGGAYVSLAQLYTKSAKSKAISELSFDTTLISNQISALLSHRVPATVIGYDSNTSEFVSIYNIAKQYNIVEWIGTDFERYKAGTYSGFIDFEKSDKDKNMTFSPDTSDLNSSSLIFAGSFDEGSVVYGSDFNDSFGWHENNSSKIFEINSTSTGNKLGLTTQPSKIYEKYYILKSAYAIAKYDNNISSCASISNSNITATDKSLLFFYDYYPWKGETFCDDAKVTILSNEASGFEVDFVNGNLQFNLTLEREIRKKGKDLKVQISKQKVVF